MTPGIQAQPPVRALVVDDDPLILALLNAFLRSRGYEVETCEDGEAALERLRRGGVNLVVTDRHMPRMDGLDLCRAMRGLPGDGYIYCIMLTASVEEKSLVDAMEAGVDDFLGKPLRLGELGGRLHAAERMLSLHAGLASRNRQLADAYGQLSRELELARVLQTGQLPPPGSFGPVRFEWMFEASGFVGGDIFDFFPLGERHLCFYLADVSGHGVAAAMIAFHAQHQLRASAQQLAAALARPAPALRSIAVGVVTEFNRRLLQMNDHGLYLTMAFGLLDLRDRKAALVHAGHPPSLLASAAGAPFEPVGEPGVPVGILQEPEYEASLVALPPGARLALYSDGITDCRDARDGAFGEDQLRRLLRDEGEAPLAQSCERLQSALRAWRGGEFEDDVTLLALEVR